MDSPESFDLRDFIPNQPSTGTILIGTVGWDDDPKWYEQGTDGSEEDGYTLVRVQTQQGHNFTSSKKAPGFKGKKILCHISNTIYKIPAKGARVYVAIPAGLEGMDAVGVIFAEVSKSPFTQFSETKAKIDLTGFDLVIKANSITLSDTSDNYIAISESNGIVVSNSAGTLLNFNGGSITGVAGTNITFLIGENGSPAGAYISIDTNAMIGAGSAMAKFNGSSGQVTLLGSAGAIATATVALGAAATVPVLMAPPPGLPSMTVFVQP